ncbi:unnamed protein product [Amoebophrya sp. A120]|nr:unnamed protein product [Amoebophrya sp. A120]|eukprot:GSA120T00014129001.1
MSWAAISKEPAGWADQASWRVTRGGTAITTWDGATIRKHFQHNRSRDWYIILRKRTGEGADMDVDEEYGVFLQQPAPQERAPQQPAPQQAAAPPGRSRKRPSVHFEEEEPTAAAAAQSGANNTNNLGPFRFSRDIDMLDVLKKSVDVETKDRLLSKLQRHRRNNSVDTAGRNEKTSSYVEALHPSINFNRRGPPRPSSTTTGGKMQMKLSDFLSSSPGAGELQDGNEETSGAMKQQKLPASLLQRKIKKAGHVPKMLLRDYKNLSGAASSRTSSEENWKVSRKPEAQQENLMHNKKLRRTTTRRLTTAGRKKEEETENGTAASAQLQEKEQEQEQKRAEQPEWGVGARAAAAFPTTGSSPTGVRSTSTFTRGQQQRSGQNTAFTGTTEDDVSSCGGSGTGSQDPGTGTPVTPTYGGLGTSSDTPGPGFPTTTAAPGLATSSSGSSTTTGDPRPTLDHLPWEDGTLTAYWDCATMGWECNNQDASTRSMPYVPTDAERTSEYKEDLWVTGAASDVMRDRGPGKKCYLIRGVESNPDFRVIAMLTNSCPGQFNAACQRPKTHIDVAAPGWDNHKFSAAQRCAEPGKLGHKESGAINNWIMNPDDDGWKYGNPPGQLTWAGWGRPKEERTTFFRDRCKELKNGYDQGCLNFLKWDWNAGDPKAKFANIPCPQAWVQKTGCPDR